MPQGTGTYQVGTAPVTPQQKAQDRAVTLRAKAMNQANQKIKAFAPGVDSATRKKIAETPADKPISFSDQ